MSDGHASAGTGGSLTSTVHDIVLKQAASHADLPAVICDDLALTYAELAERVHAVSGELTAQGFVKGQRIGVLLDRSVALPIALLGVLNAGCTFVPLDPAYPANRLVGIMQDARLHALLTGTRSSTRSQHSADTPAGNGTSLQYGGHKGTRLPFLHIDSAGRILASSRGDSRTVPAEADDSDTTPAGTRSAVGPADLAYVIFTSGSTGKPKGVMVEHRNVVNFFEGMNRVVPAGRRRVCLALTSVGFDISILELLWTLTRGFTVVIQSNPLGSSSRSAAKPATNFSLFYFGSDAGVAERDKYRLLIEGARFADAHRFAAVWTPERHFHAFGGLFPNPATTGAAIAAITDHVGIRAGSCVLPLHHPARIAEEWSVVDNLSNGRVGISFASGWQPDDFALNPTAYAGRQAAMADGIDKVKRLWRGESITFDGPLGSVDVNTLPRPLQAELPIWITAAGNPETFRLAGHSGANLLSHLLGQSIDELAEKIAIYRQARRAAGHHGPGTVSVMVHAFIHDDAAAARDIVRQPMMDYLATSMHLIRHYAAAFPTFKGASAEQQGASFSALNDADRQALLEHAFERYHASSGLFGSPEEGIAFVQRLTAIGVDDVACLIDFGVDPEIVIEQLPLLARVRDAVVSIASPPPSPVPVHELIARHGVTHLQCTPTMATLLAGDADTHRALNTLEALLVGGEALPAALAAQLRDLVGGDVINLYGPTETTIWSTAMQLSADAPANAAAPCPAVAPIGKPISNTTVQVLNESREPVAEGVTGELAIGGAGVARGYFDRPELTAERFIEQPFVSGTASPVPRWQQRLYLTGDRVWQRDGILHYVGRTDDQLKIRGHRIEPREIEQVLEQHESVQRAIVTALPDATGQPSLTAHILAADGSTIDTRQLSAHAARLLPAAMIPSQYRQHATFPQTPNGKTDRLALKNTPLDAEADASTTRTTAVVTSRELADREAAVGTPPGSPIVERAELERRIKRIWERVLNRTDVNVRENFFDAGGTSLLVIRILQGLRDDIDPDIRLVELFRHATIASLAEALAQRFAADSRAITRPANAVPENASPASASEPEDLATNLSTRSLRQPVTSADGSDRAARRAAARRLASHRTRPTSGVITP